jgi:hypothetical protein
MQCVNCGKSESKHLNKVVNKTAAPQQCVGIAVEAASNPSATVKMKLGAYVAVAA